jgi:hypothetical protein
MIHSGVQAKALARVAVALAAAGQLQQAGAAAVRAETAAQSITDPVDQAWTMSQVADGLILQPDFVTFCRDRTYLANQRS